MRLSLLSEGALARDIDKLGPDMPTSVMVDYADDHGGGLDRQDAAAIMAILAERYRTQFDEVEAQYHTTRDAYDNLMIRSLHLVPGYFQQGMRPQALDLHCRSAWTSLSIIRDVIDEVAGDLAGDSVLERLDWWVIRLAQYIDEMTNPPELADRGPPGQPGNELIVEYISMAFDFLGEAIKLGRSVLDDLRTMASRILR